MAYTVWSNVSMSFSRIEFLLLTRSRTFSSNLSDTFTFISDGANSVQPESSLSPSDITLDTQSAMASARILEIRIRSLGSLDCNLSRNSEKTEIVRLPSMKSMTAWPNQSANVEAYILRDSSAKKSDLEETSVPCKRIDTVIEHTPQIAFSGSVTRSRHGTAYYSNVYLPCEVTL